MGKLHSIILLISCAAIAGPVCFADEKPDTAPIISALMEVAKDADENVRYAAYDALKTQPHSVKVLELFWRGLDDDSARIQSLSLDKVVDLEGPTEKVLGRLTLLAMEPDLATVESRHMQNRASSHLSSIGAPAIPYLLDAVKKDEASYAAISLLGRIPLGENYATVTTQLTDLLKSEKKDVRLAAVRSLQSIMFSEAKTIADAKAKSDAKAIAEAGGIDPRYAAYYIKLIQKYDSNADGSLTKDEWSKMSKDPAAADTDQDGKISAVELAKWSFPASK